MLASDAPRPTRHPPPPAPPPAPKWLQVRATPDRRCAAASCARHVERRDERRGERWGEHHEASISTPSTEVNAQELNATDRATLRRFGVFAPRQKAAARHVERRGEERCQHPRRRTRRRVVQHRPADAAASPGAGARPSSAATAARAAAARGSIATELTLEGLEGRQPEGGGLVGWGWLDLLR